METDLETLCALQQAELERLKQQLAWVRSEIMARQRNTYQVAVAMLEMLITDRETITSDEVRHVCQQLAVMQSVYDLTLREAHQEFSALHLHSLLNELPDVFLHWSGRSVVVKILGDDLRLNTRHASALAIVLSECVISGKSAPVHIQVEIVSERLNIEVFCSDDGLPESAHREIIGYLLQYDLEAGEPYYEQISSGTRIRFTLSRHKLEQPLPS
jgi:hypothetical protein